VSTQAHTLPGTAHTPRAPDAVRWIVRTLEEAGYATWAVGGAIRDAMLGVPGDDWDLATAARPEQVRRIFRRTVPIGIAHGTVGVMARDGAMYEVTTFRRDVETDGRHAVVSFASTVEEDLARRDFTVNAIAWHPLRGELCDPFEGVRDLRDGRLRTVGDPRERFAEDYLRILRAVRFAGRFRLRIDPPTWDALVAGRGQMIHLSPERVRDELLKVLALPRPSGPLGLYWAAGILEVLHPELVGTVAPAPRAGQSPPLGLPPLRASGDSWARSLLTLDLLPADRPFLRLGVLLQELGRGGEGSDADRRRAGVARALTLLERLRFSNQQVREVAALVDALAWPPPAGASDSALRRWLADVGRAPVPAVLRGWLAGARADALRGGTDPAPVLACVRGIRREIHSGTPLGVDELALDGRALMAMGLRPGRLFGRILRHLLSEVLEDPSRNRREWLEAEVHHWLRREGADG